MAFPLGVAASCLLLGATLRLAADRRIPLIPPGGTGPTAAVNGGCDMSRADGDNRSLQRGIDILRAFRPGIDMLGNGELAERTRLPKATVSRLTRTLVNAG